jgi:tetratricopeptide (TPR) repeat protein
LKSKYIISYLLIFLSLEIICCSQTNNSDKLEDLRNKIKSYDLETSEKMLYSLIEKSRDDKNIHEYYYLLDSLQLKIYNKIYSQLNDSLKPKQNRIDHGRATATLTWGNKWPSQMTLYVHKSIKLLEEYIEKYPAGRYKYYFSDELLTTYSKSDKSKVIKVANILLESPDSAYNYEGNMFLAMIYHEDKSYQDAIMHYNNIIASRKDTIQTGSYYLYKADCYYNMNQYRDAFNCLNKSVILEQGQVHPIISKIAKEWIKIFRYNQDHSNTVKQKHVFFD